MKNSFLTLFTFFTFTLLNINAKEINVLFLGNSFTFRHELPTLVKTIIEEGQPGLKVNVERLVYGGQDMLRHYEFYQSQSMLRLNSISSSEVKSAITKVNSYAQMKKAPDFFDDYCEKVGLRKGLWEIVQGNLKKSLKTQKDILTRIEANKRV